MASTLSLSTTTGLVVSASAAVITSSGTDFAPSSGAFFTPFNGLRGSSTLSSGKHVNIRLASSRRQVARGSVRACAESREVEVVRDEEWEGQMIRETRDREYLRQRDKEEEMLKEAEYRTIGQQLLGYPEEEVRHAKKFVASLIRAGSVVEEMIVDAADNNELTPLILLVIRNRLELARHDVLYCITQNMYAHLQQHESLTLHVQDERDAIQALDLLYRRIETEMLQREAPLALQFLNELLNLHDGFSHEEWLQRSRQTMIKIFPPEDAFTFLGSPDFDLYNHHGPIEMPEEEDDVLLRIDFIREVDNLLQELEAAPELKPITGFDPASVALLLRQQEKQRAIQQVKDLRKLAATLKW